MLLLTSRQDRLSNVVAGPIVGKSMVDWLWLVAKLSRNSMTDISCCVGSTVTDNNVLLMFSENSVTEQAIQFGQC